MPTLSAILICKNEAANIEACLHSLAFCDEIVVVDSGSVDGTQEIARRFTQRVLEQPWLGFGPQKNVALDHASGDWVFSIDCDERVTPTLRDAMLRAVREPHAHAAFRVTRSNTFLGRAIRFGDWRIDAPVRLFRRDSGRFSNDAVHERVLVQEIGRAHV